MENGPVFIISAALCMAVGCAADTGKEAGKMRIKEHRSGDWTPALSESEKETLFAIAMDTLEWSVKGRRERWSFDRYSIAPKLREKCATFVTFKNKGELRGCIGTLEAVEPMYISVHTSARNAARDSRFVANPITLDELPDIEVHVSLLSPRRPINTPDEFKLGRHGICLEKHGYSAVFLPEVPIEQKWTREDTLSYLSLKAGLPRDAWRAGAQFKVYESVVLTAESP